MALSALYNALFGKKAPTDGSVIDLAEHGRVGGVSTGQPFKFIKDIDSATATVTSVSDTNTSTTILASNEYRLGATIINDSSAVLYLLLGSGDASTTNYTVRMAQYGYYEVPFNYTGIIKGIWASDPNDGGARVTELT